MIEVAPKKGPAPAAVRKSAPRPGGLPDTTGAPHHPDSLLYRDGLASTGEGQ